MNDTQQILEHIEKGLEERIQWWRENQNDPYSVGNAVITALVEVQSSIRYARAALGEGK